MENSFFHIAIPLDIEGIIKQFDFYVDSVNLVASKSSDYATEHDRRQFISHFTQIKDKVKLAKLLLQPQVDPKNITLSDDVNNLRIRYDNLPPRIRGRRSIKPHAQKLTAFLRSLFTQEQLLAILQNPSFQEESAKMVKKLAGNVLKVKDLLSFTSGVNKSFHMIMDNQDSTKTTSLKAIQEPLQDMRNKFQVGITDFMLAVIQLMEGKVSPLLLNPTTFNNEFQIILKAIRHAKFEPFSPSILSIYQSPVSVVHNNTNAYAIIHLPIYKPPILTMYKYVPNPIFINDSVALTITAPYSYMALDSAGGSTIAKQFTPSQIQDCRKINSQYFCPRANIVFKELSQECLYNIFYQVYTNIESTCQVKITKQTSHAVQLTGTTFRLYAPTQTKLIKMCQNSMENEQVSIHGEYILTLTPECPSANTPTHLFVLSTQKLYHEGTISLPSMSSNITWLSKIKQQFGNINLTKHLQDMQAHQSQPISLLHFKNHISNIPYDTYETAKEYVQDGVTVIALLVILYYSCTIACIKLLTPIVNKLRNVPKIRWFKAKQLSPQADGPYVI